jgi:hypothetical protein
MLRPDMSNDPQAASDLSSPASDEDMAQADNGNNEGVGGGNGDSEDDSGGAGP